MAPTADDDERAFIVTHDYAGSRIDRYLAAVDPAMSRARWQQLLGEGQISLNGKPAKANTVIREGDRIGATIPAPIDAEPAPENIALNIVYEDADLVVVDKPVGMVVHPGAGNRSGTLVNALLHHCTDLSGIGGVLRPGIVHRIDKDTSGLLVVAKNDATHRHLAQQFERHTIERSYEAIAWGAFRAKSGRFEGLIGRDPRSRVRMSGKVAQGRNAVTNFEVVEETPHFSRLLLRLETGRTHQIRVHCAESGHPLVGDPVYGKGRSLSPQMGVLLQQQLRAFNRQALHAAVLGFQDRHGKVHRYVSPFPEDMQRLWDYMLREDHG